MLRLSGSELARRIAGGELSSVEVVQAHIRQVRRANPTINAMVAERFLRALEEAEEADGSSPIGPFHGVPCSIKECFALTGMPNSSGLVRRADIVATEDATAVARYRAAGAIPLGVTNVSELCMWMESINDVYGTTSNPYDPRRIVGGSSGGEGAIVAAALPFGLGSDIGGSIRMPAFFNGVFGHKPSGQLVPGTGQYPMAEGKAKRMLATGPITRHAEDLWPLMKVLAGPDGQDGEEIELGEPSEVSIEGLRVLVVADNGMTTPSPEMAASLQGCADHLASRGARVEHVAIPRLKRSFDIWSSAMGAYKSKGFGELMGNGSPISPIRELARRPLGRSEYTAMASLLAIAEGLTDRVPQFRDAMLKQGEQLRVEVAEHLGDDGVMLFPPFPRTAPRHYWPFVRQLGLRFDYAYTAILNFLELPVTQVPTGLDRRGLPLGVQVIAAHGQDHRTVAVAVELERAFGGWVPPARFYA